MLLEVVVALGLLLVGMSIIGIQVHNSFQTAIENELIFRASMLAESRFAQVESGMIDFDPALIAAGEPIEEDFGRLFAPFASRILISPTTIEDLYHIQMDVLYDRNRDPDIEFEFDDAKSIYTVYTLRATPPIVDLPADYGVEEEKAQELADAFPGGELDPYAFDPAILSKLELEELVGVLPQLLDAMGISPEQAARMVPPDVMQMLEEAGYGLEDLGVEGDGADTEAGGGGR